MGKPRAEHKVQSEVTNLRTVLIAVGMAAVGLGLLWLSTRLTKDAQLEAVFAQVGGVLLATGVLTVAWEGVGRRAFAKEVFAVADLSEQVVSSGLTAMPDRFYEDVDWATLFSQSDDLDLVVSYARTWRAAHHQQLKDLAARGQLRVFLPDPDDAETVSVLAYRFNRESPEETASDIRYAIKDFHGLGPNVEVYVRRGDAVFTCYRFGSSAVLAMYSHRKERGGYVPTFVVRGGTLYSFVTNEIAAILSQSTLAPRE